MKFVEQKIFFAPVYDPLDPADIPLIERAHDDTREYAAPYQKYADAIRRFFRRQAPFGESIDDLTQETFARVLEDLPRFSVTRFSYLSYLTLIASDVLSERAAPVQDPVSESDPLLSDEEEEGEESLPGPPPEPLEREEEVPPPEEEEEFEEEELMEEEPLREETESGGRERTMEEEGYGKEPEEPL